MVNTAHYRFSVSGNHDYSDFNAFIEAARFTLDYPTSDTETNGLSLVGVMAKPGNAQPCFLIGGCPHTLAPDPGGYVIVDGHLSPSEFGPVAISHITHVMDRHPRDAGYFAGPEALAAWMRTVAKPLHARPGDAGYEGLKKAMPAFGPSYQGKGRSGANAVDVSYVLLDVDSIEGVDPRALIEAVKGLGPGLAWHSLSSTPEAPRLKILIWMADSVDKLNAKGAARALLSKLQTSLPEAIIEYGTDKIDAPGARVFVDRSQQAAGQVCFLPALGTDIETWPGIPQPVAYEGPNVTLQEYNPADDGDDSSPRAQAAIECLNRIDFAHILATEDSGTAREVIKTTIMAARYEGVSCTRLWAALDGIAPDVIARYRFDDLIEREQVAVANPVGIGSLRKLARIDIASADEFSQAPAPEWDFNRLGKINDATLAEFAAKGYADQVRVDPEGVAWWWDAQTRTHQSDDKDEALATNARLMDFLRRAEIYFDENPRVIPDSNKPPVNPITPFRRNTGYKALRAVFRRTLPQIAQARNTAVARFKLMAKEDGREATALDGTRPDFAVRPAVQEDFTTAYAVKNIVLPSAGSMLEDVAPRSHQTLAAMFSNPPEDLAPWRGQIESEQVEAYCMLVGTAVLGGWGSQKIGIITGARRCGKTTLVSSIGSVLGPLFHATTVGFLGAHQDGANDQPLYQAMDAYVAFTEEPKAINVTRATTLTNARLSAMGKSRSVRVVDSRMMSIAVTNGFTLTGATEDAAETRAAARERLFLLEAFTTPDEEERLRDPIDDDILAEAPAFLGYCVTLFLRHAWRSGKFRPGLPTYEWMPAIIDRAIEGKSASDQRRSLGAWVAAELIREDGAATDAFEAVNASRRWMGMSEIQNRASGAFAAARKQFEAAMKALGVETGRQGKTAVIKARIKPLSPDF